MRKHWFQIAVVALLALIWLEIGGADTVSRIARQAEREVGDMFGGPKEEPAPGRGGFEFDNSAAVEALARSSAPAK